MSLSHPTVCPSTVTPSGVPGVEDTRNVGLRAGTTHSGSLGPFHSLAWPAGPTPTSAAWLAALNARLLLTPAQHMDTDSRNGTSQSSNPRNPSHSEVGDVTLVPYLSPSDTAGMTIRKRAICGRPDTGRKEDKSKARKFADDVQTYKQWHHRSCLLLAKYMAFYGGNHNYPSTSPIVGKRKSHNSHMRGEQRERRARRDEKEEEEALLTWSLCLPQPEARTALRLEDIQDAFAQMQGTRRCGICVEGSCGSCRFVLRR
ncbi:hypothetical protein DFH29DRAFT_1068361 [Suillus ampliporus]|nr:hypothetical protein DFH29DRAFT_1068361 [Suillus ampliporus]